MVVQLQSALRDSAEACKVVLLAVQARGDFMS